MCSTMGASLYDNVPFDIVSDFNRIISLGEGAQWLMVLNDAGIYSLAELLERARKEPGKLRYPTSGAGTTVTICSSVNRLFFMGSSSHGSHLPRNYWSGKTGQVRSLSV